MENIKQTQTKEIFDHQLQLLKDYFTNSESVEVKQFIDFTKDIYRELPSSTVFIAGGVFRDLCLGLEIKDMNDLDLYIRVKDPAEQLLLGETLAKLCLARFGKEIDCQDTKKTGQIVYKLPIKELDACIAYNPLDIQTIEDSLFNRDFAHNSGGIIIDSQFNLIPTDPFGAMESIQNKVIKTVGIPDNLSEEEKKDFVLEYKNEIHQKINRAQEKLDSLNAELLEENSKIEKNKAELELAGKQVSKKESEDFLKRQKLLLREISGLSSFLEDQQSYFSELRGSDDLDVINEIIVRRKFNDDPNRALRSVRQGIKFGERFDFDPLTWDSIKHIFTSPHNFPADKQSFVLAELKKSFETDPLVSLKLFTRLGALEYFVNLFTNSQVSLGIENYTSSYKKIASLSETDQGDLRLILVYLLASLPAEQQKVDKLIKGIEGQKQLAETVNFLLSNIEVFSQFGSLVANDTVKLEKLFYQEGVLDSEKVRLLKILNLNNVCLDTLPKELPKKTEVNLQGLKGPAIGEAVKKAREAQLSDYFKVLI